MTRTEDIQKPTPAFIGASWLALLIGLSTYIIGLFNASMELNEKGYYFTVLMFGLFAAVSLQKSVRDKTEGIAVTAIYYGLAWFSLVLAVTLLCIGLWNAGSLELSEKGFYGIAFVMSVFASVAVQKNVRDVARYKLVTEAPYTEALPPYVAPTPEPPRIPFS
ncbi:inner membrane protein YiaA [Klugiella xanthotipulae]|uniref:Putative membrane protein YiaA n=1 Tax=Klugiella xanthotipulae TaxID=244735 RepID=A0A543I4D9_9MICO|nr:inner membrane protein YiaA [Klugiella xanthotipulae]TQM65458.1 putative membrane protein YiaA [Klugiella xanthotipulae]